MSLSLAFIFSCSCFLAGILTASFFKLSLAAGFFISIAGLFLIGITWSRPKMAVTGFCLIFYVLGAWHFQSFESAILKQREELGDSGRKAEITGRIIFEPDRRQSYTNLKVEIEEIRFLDGEEEKNAVNSAGAVVWAAVENYPEFSYNDRIRMEGELKIPKRGDSFNWPGYLAKEGAVWQISWPKAELLEKSRPVFGWPWIYSKILSVKKEMEEVIYRNLSLNEGALLSGLIFGDRSLMSDEFKEKMNETGLSHIAAVSGSNVIILASILMAFLVGAGLWRQQAFWLTLFFIWVFVILVGLPSSAVRAGIMASLLLFAQYLGRQNTSWRAMILAAAIMLSLNPLLLRYDAGFQLSFLAVGGLIFLSPIIKESIKFVPEEKFLNIKEILAQTLAAQAATLPLIVYNFGCVSLVSPLSNILIVPAIPLIMALGFVFVLAGLICPWLGWILSWPVFFLLAIAVKIIDMCASLPFASFALSLSWGWLAVFYVSLLAVIIKKRKKEFLSEGYL
ncbi:MAG: ComEC/Rec2 family competence protein [Candidatus Paceibacterota bacterium]|jgi:competence protein ComEC